MATIEDVRRIALSVAIDWLYRVSGFSPLEVMQNDGSSMHVEPRLGGGVIMPTSSDKCGDPNNPWNQPLHSQSRYVALDKIDADYAQAMAGGADISRPRADIVAF